jgi:sugar-specific transcriptional regulator TrmB
MINMTKLEKLLESIGITKTEGAIFNHLYHAGPDTASSLSAILSINRATSYHALHGLHSKGLVISETKNGSKLFRVSENDVFTGYFEYKEEQLTKHKTELKDYTAKHLPRQSKNRESTEIYTGDDGIRLALEKAFKCKSKKWNVVAPKNNYFTEADEEFADYYIEKRKKYKIRARSLWEMPKGKSQDNFSVRKVIAEERNPRYLPKEGAVPFTSIAIIYDTSVLFISSHGERTAILIHSESVHSVLSMQFETLYALSQKPVLR